MGVRILTQHTQVIGGLILTKWNPISLWHVPRSSQSSSSCWPSFGRLGKSTTRRTGARFAAGVDFHVGAISSQLRGEHLLGVYLRHRKIPCLLVVDVWSLGRRVSSLLGFPAAKEVLYETTSRYCKGTWVWLKIKELGFRRF